MKEYLLKKDNTYIVGVSGGVDSMALLDMLRNKQYKIMVCHVNYNLRHDSNEDQVLVEEYCQKYQIPCFIKEINKDAYGNENFQMQARNIRYQFYKEIGKQYNINKLIVGHHKDDVIETILMQLQRKNTKGFLGIQEVSEIFGLVVYRPLLAIYKEELYQYCKQQKVLYHEDYTNFQTDFTRDYIRNITLSSYSKEQKEEILHKAILHNERVTKRHTQCLPYYQQYQQQGYLKYKDIEKDLYEDILYMILKDTIYPPDISNAILVEIVKQLESPKPNAEVALSLNTVFIKEYDNMYVSKNRTRLSYCLKYPHLVYDKHEYFYLSKTGHINEGVYVNNEDLPLVIRSYKPGDTIITSGGTKKISRLFIDKKIPKRERYIWPIVERSDGTIVLVPNIAKNIRYLYTKPNVFVIKYKDLRSE